MCILYRRSAWVYGALISIDFTPFQLFLRRPCNPGEENIIRGLVLPGRDSSVQVAVQNPLVAVLEGVMDAAPDSPLYRRHGAVVLDGKGLVDMLVLAVHPGQDSVFQHGEAQQVLSRSDVQQNVGDCLSCFLFSHFVHGSVLAFVFINRVVQPENVRCREHPAAQAEGSRRPHREGAESGEAQDRQAHQNVSFDGLGSLVFPLHVLPCGLVSRHPLGNQLFPADCLGSSHRPVGVDSGDHFRFVGIQRPICRLSGLFLLVVLQISLENILSVHKKLPLLMPSLPATCQSRPS
nr:MAG TPA_asm: hypothetical protein [Caudoviricetes sp.]